MTYSSILAAPSMPPVFSSFVGMAEPPLFFKPLYPNCYIVFAVRETSGFWMLFFCIPCCCGFRRHWQEAHPVNWPDAEHGASDNAIFASKAPVTAVQAQVPVIAHHVIHMGRHTDRAAVGFRLH